MTHRPALHVPVKTYDAPLSATGQFNVPLIRFGGLPETVPMIVHPPALLKDTEVPFI
jgi:hypothetical protein